MTNTLFCKPKSRLWTFRAPNKFKSQIDFILCRRIWRKSIMDSQAHSSSNPIGPDHRIVCAKLRLSVRAKKHPPRPRLNWDAITPNQDVASRADWEALERTQINSYKDYVDRCNKAGSVILPPRVAFKTSGRHTNEVNAARIIVISALPETVSTAQTTLCNTYNETQEKHYLDFLRAFDSCLEVSKTKQKSKTIFIQGEDRLDAWKTYFKQLLQIIREHPTNQLIRSMRPQH